MANNVFKTFRTGSKGSTHGTTAEPATNKTRMTPLEMLQTLIDNPELGKETFGSIGGFKVDDALYSVLVGEAARRVALVHNAAAVEFYSSPDVLLTESQKRFTEDLQQARLDAHAERSAHLNILESSDCFTPFPKILVN